MLGAPCSPCCKSCDIAEMQSQIPEITVTISTDGFAAGSPANGGENRFACLAKNDGDSLTAMWNRASAGSFYEATGSHTLVPGPIPPPTTDTLPWLFPQGYVKTLPTVLGRLFNYSVNPHIALRFLCGTQQTPNQSGNFLWATLYVCVPIYTNTDTYTYLFTSGNWDLTVQSGNSYGTGENPDQSYVPFLNMDGWYVSDYDVVPVESRLSFGRMIVYQGARPPVRITNYVEQNELITTSSAAIAQAIPLVSTYEHVYFQGGAALVGEFVNGNYVLYDNATVSHDQHRRVTGVSSRAFPSVNKSFSFVANYNRFPLFVRRFVGGQGITFAQNQLMRRILGWPSSLGCSGSESQPYGKNTYEVPGTPLDSGVLFGGPTATITISNK